MSNSLTQFAYLYFSLAKPIRAGQQPITSHSPIRGGQQMVANVVLGVGRVIAGAGSKVFNDDSSSQVATPVIRGGSKTGEPVVTYSKRLRNAVSKETLATHPRINSGYDSSTTFCFAVFKNMQAFALLT